MDVFEFRWYICIIIEMFVINLNNICSFNPIYIWCRTFFFFTNIHCVSRRHFSFSYDDLDEGERKEEEEVSKFINLYKVACKKRFS